MQAEGDVTSSESKQLMKQVGELESLHTAWKDWENTREVRAQARSSHSCAQLWP